MKQFLTGKMAVLLAVLLLALGVGAVFLLMPGMKRDKARAQQDALFESITQGDGTITIPAQLADLDFYDPPTNGGEPQPDVIPADLLPPCRSRSGHDGSRGRKRRDYRDWRIDD
jgi:hypothetical protein